MRKCILKASAGLQVGLGIFLDSSRRVSAFQILPNITLFCNNTWMTKYINATNQLNKHNCFFFLFSAQYFSSQKEETTANALKFNLAKFYISEIIKCLYLMVNTDSTFLGKCHGPWRGLLNPYSEKSEQNFNQRKYFLKTPKILEPCLKLKHPEEHSIGAESFPGFGRKRMAGSSSHE